MVAPATDNFAEKSAGAASPHVAAVG
jgi:hypothetical protein